MQGLTGFQYFLKRCVRGEKFVSLVLAVLLRELRRELNATLAELFERPPASSGLSDHTTSAIDVVARLLQEEPTRAIVGE